MKNLILLLSFFTWITLLYGQNGHYQINEELSKLKWIGKKVTGSHEGIIAIQEGFVLIEQGKIKSGELVIDMESIVITDIPDQSSNDKLKYHLISTSFFGVAKYPISTLKVISANYLVDGSVVLNCALTIKNITKQLKIPVDVLLVENKIVVTGKVEIDRTLFDLKYGSGSFFDNLGDKAILDNFVIKFKVAAMQQ